MIEDSTNLLTTICVLVLALTVQRITIKTDALKQRGVIYINNGAK